MKQYNLRRQTNGKIMEAERLIRQNGGIIYEDDSFKVKGIKGKYKRNNNSDLIIAITDKPFFLGWGTIESQLAKFFR